MCVESTAKPVAAATHCARASALIIISQSAPNLVEIMTEITISVSVIRINCSTLDLRSACAHTDALCMYQIKFPSTPTTKKQKIFAHSLFWLMVLLVLAVRVCVCGFFSIASSNWFPCASKLTVKDRWLYRRDRPHSVFCNRCISSQLMHGHFDCFWSITKLRCS